MKGRVVKGKMGFQPDVPKEEVTPDDPYLQLSPRRQRFVDEYMIDLCQSKAAARAGYSDMTARAQASLIMRDPIVQAAVRKRMQERVLATHINADRVVLELAKLAFANMADFVQKSENGDILFDFSTVTDDHLAAITELTVDEYADPTGKRQVTRTRFKLADKRAALVDLGRHIGMFKERVELTGSGGGPIQSQVVPLDFDAVAKRSMG